MLKQSASGGNAPWHQSPLHVEAALKRAWIAAVSCCFDLCTRSCMDFVSLTVRVRNQRQWQQATDVMQVVDPLASLVQYWEDQNPDSGELWYPVSWDWRRDFWEQSEAVYKMALWAKNQTVCNPILVGHSMGGVLTYTAFTRYREALAENVHAVLYATAPLQPFSGTEQSTSKLLLLLARNWLSASHPLMSCAAVERECF
jgi:pimeloyl-ACP methyl ester carboxylesterase